MTLERIEHKVFASEAPLDEMGQFGSALATTKLNTKDVAEIQALPAYTKGWGSAIISENNYPAMEEMNGVLNVMSYHTGYLYQEGIPTYSATQEYSVTSWVKDLAGEKVYKSLQGGNKGHDLTDPAWWEELKLGGGGLEIGDIGFTQMAIDETKGKRRKLNGQLIIQEQYVQFTNIIKQSVALNPDLACTEEEWQTAVTMSEAGICYKYVIDDEAGTIRLPKYPDYFIGGVNNIAHVVGNGMAVGLTNGTDSMAMATNQANNLCFNGAVLGAPVGTKWATMSVSNLKAIGITTDTTKSGMEAQIQQEQIKGTYFIQVATGSETEDNIINEIELNNPFFLGMSQYFESEPNNISWLKSAGQYNSKAIYPAYYDWLLKIYNGVEVVEGVSVKLSTEDYTDYDFVLNTADETFRLPLLNGSEDLPSNKYIDLTLEASGTIYTAIANGWVQFSKNPTATNQFINLTSASGVASTVWSTSAQALRTYIHVTKGETFAVEYTATGSTESFRFAYAQGNGSLYFYVGETVQNANLINAGRIEEKIASLIPDNSSLIAGYAMPSSRYIDLTLGATGTIYTAPANGFFAIRAISNGANQELYLGTANIFTNNFSVASGAPQCVYLPVKKGENVQLWYGTSISNIEYFRFVYTEGSESEAN